MSIITAFSAGILGLLSGFIFHKLAESRYWLRARFILYVPMILIHPGGRTVAYLVATALLLGALLLSGYWWLSGLIAIVQFTSWKSGEHVAKESEISMMAFRYIEEGLSELDAKAKATETIETLLHVRARNLG